jgi:hypothetical protein
MPYPTQPHYDTREVYNMSGFLLCIILRPSWQFICFKDQKTRPSAVQGKIHILWNRKKVHNRVHKSPPQNDHIPNQLNIVHNLKIGIQQLQQLIHAAG